MARGKSSAEPTTGRKRSRKSNGEAAAAMAQAQEEREDSKITSLADSVLDSEISALLQVPMLRALPDTFVATGASPTRALIDTAAMLTNISHRTFTVPVRGSAAQHSSLDFALSSAKSQLLFCAPPYHYCVADSPTVRARRKTPVAAEIVVAVENATVSYRSVRSDDGIITVDVVCRCTIAEVAQGMSVAIVDSAVEPGFVKLVNVYGHIDPKLAIEARCLPGDKFTPGELVAVTFEPKCIRAHNGRPEQPRRSRTQIESQGRRRYWKCETRQEALPEPKAAKGRKSKRQTDSEAAAAAALPQLTIYALTSEYGD